MIYFLLLAILFLNYKLIMLTASSPKKIIKWNNKLKFAFKWLQNECIYALFYKYAPINNHSILFESHLGHDIGGNPYYLLLEILKNEKYKNFKCYVVGNKKDILEKQTLHDAKIEVIEYCSFRYYYHLATSKFLVNDVTFKAFFIKKEGQSYLNTWHGTPLKAMGRSIEYNPVFLSNTQRNFIQADCLLAPNKHVLDMIQYEYMLDGLQNKEITLSGYPRNEVFFKDYSYIKKELSLNDKTIFCYMPTWRGGKNKLENFARSKELQANLDYLSDNLASKQVLYVKLHPLSLSSINLALYDNIKPFPSQYETYEFLSQADMLITDYSSVLFDFANANKKIILFSYDYDDYTSERGFSLDFFKDIPFVKASSKEILLEEMNKVYSIDNTLIEEFKNTFCSYDSERASFELCNYFIDKVPAPSTKLINKRDKLTLIYSGQFLRNGITTSLLNLFSNLDLDEIKVVCNFNQGLVKKDSYEAIAGLEKEISYIPNKGKMLLTPLEKLIIFFRVRGKFLNKYSESVEKVAFQREAKRLYGNIQFDELIHFTGYDRKPCFLYKHMNANKTIFVHNDMEQELTIRANYSPFAVFSAWKSFNNIAVVRESLYQPCIKVLPEIKNKVMTVHNSINFELSYQKSQSPLKNLVTQEIENLLDNVSTKKIITIGRFSPEKGHIRLIEAFELVATDNDNIDLYIMGGHGPFYTDTINRVSQSEFSHRIHVLVGISNPYPVLKRMDLFILPSFYEGLPMVFFEAILMGVPIISTDIDGPSQFLNEGYGTVVDNSTAGLALGMNMFLDGDILPTQMDLNSFNEKAKAEFLSLMK